MAHHCSTQPPLIFSIICNFFRFSDFKYPEILINSSIYLFFVPTSGLLHILVSSSVHLLLCHSISIRAPASSFSSFKYLDYGIFSQKFSIFIIFIFDFISYSSVWSYFFGLKMHWRNFLSWTASFILFLFDVGHVSYAYKIP